MAINREIMEERKKEIDLYRQYQNTLEYRMCRDSGGQVSACFKQLVLNILREIQLKLGNRFENRYRKYASTVTFEQRIPQGSKLILKRARGAEPS